MAHPKERQGMAVAPLKFRCYQCNGLLGVSRSKVGAVVSCPKCRAELIVPDPDDSESALADEGTDPVPSPGAFGVSDAGQTFDLLDINPEDIRVEPGVEWAPRTSVEAPPRQEEVAFAPIETRRPEVAPPVIPPPVVVPPVIPPDPRPVDPVVPPIRVDEPRLSEPRWSPSRSRDVVLPRSAVATWSLFVLIAQGLAFLAGLLAGHFLWRVH